MRFTLLVRCFFAARNEQTPAKRSAFAWSKDVTADTLLMLLLPGMDGERDSGLSNGDRVPEQHFGATGVEPYYHQSPLQYQSSQEAPQYHTSPQMHTDSAYSRQSSFETPSEPASYVAAPQPPPRKQSQRQRSGNLSMLRVSSPCFLRSCVLVV